MGGAGPGVGVVGLVLWWRIGLFYMEVPIERDKGEGEWNAEE